MQIRLTVHNIIKRTYQNVFGLTFTIGLGVVLNDNLFRIWYLFHIILLFLLSHYILLLDTRPFHYIHHLLVTLHYCLISNLLRVDFLLKQKNSDFAYHVTSLINAEEWFCLLLFKDFSTEFEFERIKLYALSIVDFIDLESGLLSGFS